jgi:predicted ATPase/transcriptional regulator with XRE-family HTH domain
MSGRPPPPLAVLLRALRRSAGLTQEELAQAARVGVRTLRDLETGQTTRPHRSTVDLLASAFGLTGADRERFLTAARGGSGSPTPNTAGGTAARSRAAQVVLPQPVRLIGREEMIRGVCGLLDVVGLVALVGLGGVGKSALAVAVGHRVADRFPGGVVGLNVTSASTAADLLTRLAETFGLSRVDALPHRLSVAPVLLVLDGADRSPDAIRAMLGELRDTARDDVVPLQRPKPAQTFQPVARPDPALRTPPVGRPRPSVGLPIAQLRVLVTSRYPLGLPEEHEWPVPPLETPPPEASGREVLDSAAVALFVERLRRVRQGPLDPNETEVLADLARGLGGVPHALELAAAAGRVLEPKEMLARLVGARDEGFPPRQSLRDAVQASWDLLSADERTCLAGLTTLPERWSIVDAENLGGTANVLAAVDRLVALGLVGVQPDAGEQRFWVLEPVRDFTRRVGQR